jgi:hypothetical protein
MKGPVEYELRPAIRLSEFRRLFDCEHDCTIRKVMVGDTAINSKTMPHVFWFYDVKFGLIDKRFLPRGVIWVACEQEL